MGVPAATVLLGIVGVFLGIGVVALTWSSWQTLLVLLIFGAVIVAIFVTVSPFIRLDQLSRLTESQVRQSQLRSARSRHPVQLGELLSAKQLRDAYFLVVLGSGGHTKEMLAMMEVNFPAVAGLHRRYIVSSGDTMSLKHLKAFEDSVTATHGEKNAGTYDVHIVTRARKIHQTLMTVPISGFQSLLDIFPLLLRSPFTGPRSRQNYPDVILTNGPATGFFVGLVAWVLKIFHIVPEDAAQILYVESWARIKTLSLTGLLFYYLDMADVFLVQHEKVAKKYGVQNAGCMVVKRRS